MGDAWKGRTVIVTGAGTGVGRALAGELAARGAIVYVTARSLDKCEPVARAIVEAGHRAFAAKLDVRDYAELRALIERVRQEHGRLDVLVNNAAVLYLGEFYDMDETTIESLVHTNLTAVLVATLYAYRVMKEQRFGRIVNVSSMGGYLPNATMVAYSATKFGLSGLDMSLEAEAEAFGVKLQTVYLGFVESEMLNKAEMRHGSPQTVHDLLPYDPQPASIAARNIADGIERDQRFIFTPGYARVFWLINRFLPALLRAGARKTMADYRRLIELSRDADPRQPNPRAAPTPPDARAAH